jgi:hypothetical protein
LIFTTYSNSSSYIVTVANPERTVQQTERAAREMKEKMFCKGGEGDALLAVKYRRQREQWTRS